MRFYQSLMDELYKYLRSDQVTKLTTIYLSFYFDVYFTWKHIKVHFLV
jgi:hypothetical protein